MNFSTWKGLATIGMIIVPLVMFFIFLGATQSLELALIITGIFVAIILPLQFYQTDRLQARLDDYGGRVPLSLMWDWDLVDDSESPEGDLDAEARQVDTVEAQRAGETHWLGEAEVPGRTCSACGKSTLGDDPEFCSHCGNRLRPPTVS